MKVSLFTLKEARVPMFLLQFIKTSCSEKQLKNVITSWGHSRSTFVVERASQCDLEMLNKDNHIQHGVVKFLLTFSKGTLSKTLQTNIAMKCCFVNS